MLCGVWLWWVVFGSGVGRDGLGAVGKVSEGIRKKVSCNAAAHVRNASEADDPPYTPLARSKAPKSDAPSFQNGFKTN